LNFIPATSPAFDHLQEQNDLFNKQSNRFGNADFSGFVVAPRTKVFYFSHSIFLGKYLNIYSPFLIKY
jgi:hypothetical protein